jgi:3-oxoisoapionate decarboxylase
MRIGIDNYSAHHLELTGIALLQHAEKFGLAGVQFDNYSQVTPRFDRTEAAEVRDYAIANGLYLEGGMPCPNPHRPGPLALRDGDGDFRRGLRRHLEGLAEVVVGSRAVRCFVGGPGDRTRGAPWRQQLADTAAVVRELSPVLRDLELKLAFENHADATIGELIHMIEEVGQDVMGICLDTGNLVITLDEPLEAGRRAAPYTIATQIKDGIVVFDQDGLTFNPRPLGEGMVPLQPVLEEVARFHPDVLLSIEDHGRLFPIPIFDDEFMATFDRLKPTHLAHVVRLARECEQRIERGEVPSPAEVESVPWPDRADERMRRGARHLKQIVDRLPAPAAA